MHDNDLIEPSMYAGAA